MTQEKKKLILKLQEERHLSLHMGYTTMTVHHTADLLAAYPDGVLLIAIHNQLTTLFHFDQAGPCQLLEFDEKGLHTGTNESGEGRGALFSYMAQGRFLLLRPGIFKEENRPHCIVTETLSPALIDAYLTTRYVVDEPHLEIRIGTRNPGLDALLEKHQGEKWAYITAFNPASVQLSPDENDQRHAKLAEALGQYSCYEGKGIGTGIDNEWPPERSLLVIGIDKEKAEAIGRQFGQYAIVTGALHSPAFLRILAGGIPII